MSVGPKLTGDEAGDDDSAGPSTPGPEPERLKLPVEDWKEALRRALEGARSAEDKPVEEDDGDGASEDDD